MRWCYPRTHLRDSDTLRLAGMYHQLGVPTALQVQLATEPELDAHVALFMAWWGAQPQSGAQGLPDDLVDTLNGEHTVRRLGMRVYRLFSAGTHGCKCCMGYRLAALLFALPALGAWVF